MVTAITRALKINPTTIYPWVLHGAIDQALKTTCQSDSVKFFPMVLPDFHGRKLDLEMWTPVHKCGDTGVHTPNEAARSIVALEIMRRMHINSNEELHALREQFVQTLEKEAPPIFGSAVITGAGGTNVPEEDELGCLVVALLAPGGDHH